MTKGQKYRQFYRRNTWHSGNMHKRRGIKDSIPLPLGEQTSRTHIYDGTVCRDFLQHTMAKASYDSNTVMFKTVKNGLRKYVLEK
jgi:hypothetical protein